MERLKKEARSRYNVKEGIQKREKTRRGRRRRRTRNESEKGRTERAVWERRDEK
jgi:hypothetical protein